MQNKNKESLSGLFLVQKHIFSCAYQKKAVLLQRIFITTFFVTTFFVIVHYMENPFKFGSIVENEFFTDRVKEVAYIRQFIESRNHLVLISPRRFGKSSVVLKAVKQAERQYINLNLQEVTSLSDFAAKLLREVYRIHPMEKLRQWILRFRVIPTISTNQLTGALEIGFQPTQDQRVLLEDVLALIENMHTEQDRLVVILDEFQEILEIAPALDKQLRAIMQQQRHINYILLGSQESMMTDIFENVKSPFYHFGELMRLQKLPRTEFDEYLRTRFEPVFKDKAAELSRQVLDYTDCHPYYSQQLAFHMWQIGILQPEEKNVHEAAVQQIVLTHNLDYERIWMNFKRTSKWLLLRLAKEGSFQTGEYRTSTLYSSLKRLQQMGYVIYTDHYEIEDPFFCEWLRKM